MNPRLILTLLIILGSKGGAQKSYLPSLRFPRFPNGPAYVDTFKMEMALDRLHAITDAIDKINNLNQTRKIPAPTRKPPSIDRVQESLEAVKGLLADGKSSQQVDSLATTLSGVKKLGNLDELVSVMGPILSSFKDTSKE